jgi:DNA repair protein RecO (recombination protein O)
MMQIVTDAVVLRRINYQEADRVVTYITKDQGIITTIAKGVRRSKSKLAGSIELFGTSQISYIPGKGNMSTLVSARLIKNYGSIVKDLSRTQMGYEVLKLINKNIEEAGDESIYALLVDTLEFLNSLNINLDLIKLWFTLRFLDLMGHSPNLIIEKSDSANLYKFDQDKMMFIESENGSLTQNHIKLIRLAMINNPDILNKVSNLSELINSLVSISQNMLISNGFNPI